MEKVNLSEKLARFGEHWQPRTVGQFNGHDLMVVKVKGEFVWHDHKDTDETFIVLEGEMLLKFRNKEVKLRSGEMYVVPKGVEHKPCAENECKILVIEPRGVINTGDAGGELTINEDQWI